MSTTPQSRKLVQAETLPKLAAIQHAALLKASRADMTQSGLRALSVEDVAREISPAYAKLIWRSSKVRSASEKAEWVITRSQTDLTRAAGHIENSPEANKSGADGGPHNSRRGWPKPEAEAAKRDRRHHREIHRRGSRHRSGPMDKGKGSPRKSYRAVEDPTQDTDRRSEWTCESGATGTRRHQKLVCAVEPNDRKEGKPSGTSPARARKTPARRT